MPRPRFTLRVILAITAIVAVLAWQGGIVVQRKAAMDAQHAFIIATPVQGQDAPTINPLRELFGDKPILLIYVDPKNATDDEMERLNRLFPEALITLLPMGSD